MQKYEVEQVIKTAIAKQAELEVYPEDVFEDVWIMRKTRKNRQPQLQTFFANGKNYKSRLKELRRLRALEILDEAYANLNKEILNAHKK